MTEGQGRGGIINMGNTCYANATLQAFRNCGKIPWIFEKGRFDTLFRPVETVKEGRAKQQALAKTFADVIQLLQQCKRGQSVRPADFWEKFRVAVADTGFDHLAQKIPHDSHEFYLFLLDCLHESMAQDTTMKITRGPPVTELEKHRIAALETWKREFENKYSPLVDLFYGLQHIVVKCETCGNKSHRWEIFSALKATVPSKPQDGKPPSLAAMLQEEFKPETIEDYVCDACAPKRTVATKSTAIWRLPLHTVIVLKRFTPDGRKIQTPMAALNPVEPFSFEPFFSAESPERGGETRFALHSIVDHHGVSGGGHYTAQCKAGATDGWIMYDDESCQPLPGAKPIFGSSTYMLWFQRVLY